MEGVISLQIHFFAFLNVHFKQELTEHIFPLCSVVGQQSRCDPVGYVGVAAHTHAHSAHHPRAS